jgi:hypothetical protein
MQVNITRILFIADVTVASVDAITLHATQKVESAERNGAAGLSVVYQRL